MSTRVKGFEYNWNSIIEKLVTGLASFIPEIGGVISFFLGLFWPDYSPHQDIWSQLVQKITDLVEKIVDAKILKQEITARQADLDGLRDSMKLYMKAKNHEKGSLLAAMLVVSDTLYEQLETSDNDVSLMPIMLAHSLQHLTLLRERMMYGKDMYDEDNTTEWTAELHGYLQKYQDYFVKKKSKWTEWWHGKIEVKRGWHLQHTRHSQRQKVGIWD